MLNTLDHVILAVADLDVATGRYARLLGRSPSWRGEHPGVGSANVLFRLENTYLELLAPAGEGPVGAALEAHLSSRGEGPIGLAFGTDDADACHAWLVARGLAPQAVERGVGRDVESGAMRAWRRVPLPLDQTRGVLLFAIEHESPPEILPLSGPMADASAVVFALDHAVVRSADAEATKALYGDGLGLRLALDREFPQWGARLLFFRVGGLTVEIAAALADGDGEGLGGEGAPGVDGDRFWGLSYRVRDADAAHARLTDMGIDVSEVRKGRKPGTRVFTVQDGTCGVPTLMLEPGERPGD